MDKPTAFGGVVRMRSGDDPEGAFAGISNEKERPDRIACLKDSGTWRPAHVVPRRRHDREAAAAFSGHRGLQALRVTRRPSGRVISARVPGWPASMRAPVVSSTTYSAVESPSAAVARGPITVTSR